VAIILVLIFVLVIKIALQYTALQLACRVMRIKTFDRKATECTFSVSCSV